MILDNVKKRELTSTNCCFLFLEEEETMDHLLLKSVSMDALFLLLLVLLWDWRDCWRVKVIQRFGKLILLACFGSLYKKGIWLLLKMGVSPFKDYKAGFCSSVRVGQSLFSLGSLFSMGFDWAGFQSRVGEASLVFLWCPFCWDLWCSLNTSCIFEVLNLLFVYAYLEKNKKKIKNQELLDASLLQQFYYCSTIDAIVTTTILLFCSYDSGVPLPSPPLFAQFWSLFLFLLSFFWTSRTFISVPPPH